MEPIVPMPPQPTLSSSGTAQLQKPSLQTSTAPEETRKRAACATYLVLNQMLSRNLVRILPHWYMQDNRIGALCVHD